MDEQVKNYIETKLAEKRKIDEMEKEELLLREGLYKKVYSPNDEKSDEFPKVEVDQHGNEKYFKRVFPEIDDKEYAVIKKLAGEKKRDKELSIVGTIFKIFAIIILLIGIFISIGMMSYDTATGFTTLITYFVMAMGCFAVSTIIQLLMDIKNKK